MWFNTHVFEGCFTGTGAIIWLPQCQRSNLEWYRKNCPIPIQNKAEQNITHVLNSSGILYMLVIWWHYHSLQLPCETSIKYISNGTSTWCLTIVKKSYIYTVWSLEGLSYMTHKPYVFNFSITFNFMFKQDMDFNLIQWGPRCIYASSN